MSANLSRRAARGRVGGRIEFAVGKNIDRTKVQIFVILSILLAGLSGCWQGDQDLLGKEIRGDIYSKEGDIYLMLSDQKYDNKKFIINSISLEADSGILFECIENNRELKYVVFPLPLSSIRDCNSASLLPKELAPAKYSFLLMLSAHDDSRNIWRPYLVRGEFILDYHNVITNVPY